MGKEYTAEDGYLTQDLIHASADHFQASKKLYEQRKSEYLDSAGYLAHLSIELLLKAMLLHSDKKFPNTHNLEGLIGRVAAGNNKAKLKGNDAHFRKVLLALDKCYGLRYPDRGSSAGVGTGDLPVLELLYERLIQAMPIELSEQFNTISKTEKFGREIRSGKC